MSIKKLSTRFFIFSVFLVLSLSGCTSQRILDADAEAILYPKETYIPESFYWQQVQPGIDRFDYENPNFPIIYHAVRIDLTTPGLELVCVPTASAADTSSGGVDASGTSPTSSATVSAAQTGRSRRQATSSFAAEQNCVIAINATQFDLSSIIGIHKANGIVISAPQEKYAAIAFRRELPCPTPAASGAGDTTDAPVASGASEVCSTPTATNTQNAGYSAKIFAAQTAPELAEYDFAFGGFFVVLENGEVCYDFIRRHTSRTGAGLSPDGRTLYILVVEGERPLKSEGLSYPQCGEIFKAMGCTDALEFDGGDSTELCINGKSVLSYKNWRIQANSFGFKCVQE